MVRLPLGVTETQLIKEDICATTGMDPIFSSNSNSAGQGKIAW